MQFAHVLGSRAQLAQRRRNSERNPTLRTAFREATLADDDEQIFRLNLSCARHSQTLYRAADG